MSTFIQIVLWLFCASTKYWYEEILSWDKQEKENHIREILFIERHDIIVIRVLFNSMCAIFWKSFKLKALPTELLLIEIVYAAVFGIETENDGLFDSTFMFRGLTRNLTCKCI